MSNFNIGNVSGSGNIFGDHGHVNITLSRSLDDLTEAVDENGEDLLDPETMRRATAELRDEITSQPPNRTRITRLLDRLRQGAGTVAAVATAVEGVEHVLDAL